MRLPLKTEYACQVMAQLARSHGSGEVRRVEELAEAEGLSANYLVQILTQLRPTGLVISKRGKNGGYLLGRDPKTITLAEIVSAVEGETLIETSGGNRGMCSGTVTQAWAQANQEMVDSLQRIPLSDLIPVTAESEASPEWII